MSSKSTKILISIITLILIILGIEIDSDIFFDKSPIEEVEEIRTGTYVSRVVDGDTIVVIENGIEKKIRLIGINTPETVDPRKPVECFGKEASDKAKELLENKNVILESDESQGDRDKYERHLRYIFLEDGTNVNETLIEEGFAYEYTYDLPYKYQIDFKKAEQEAKEQKRGLWGDVCEGLI